jgi:hypothetical protein
MILSEMGYEVLPVIDSAKKVKYRPDSNVDLLIADIFYDGRPIGLEIVVMCPRPLAPGVLARQ